MTTPPRNPQAKKAARKAEETARTTTSGHGATAPGNRREALAAQRQAEADRKRKQRMLLLALGIVVGTLVIVLVAWALISAGQKAAVVGRPAHANAEVGIKVHPEATKSGAPKVELWSDPQCPACKFFEDGVGDELTKLAKQGDVALEIHPLTFIEDNYGQQWSTKANEAAACADMASVNKYPEVFAAIYGHQPAKEGDGFTDDILLKAIPNEVGITGDALTAYTKCYNDREMKGFVKAVDTAGRASIPRDAKGQWGTPTYTVNGKKLDLSPLYDQKSKQWNASGLLDLIKKNA